MADTVDFSQDPFRQAPPAMPWPRAFGGPSPDLAEVQLLVQAQVQASRQASARAKRIELLSERLSRHLAPEVWQRLFHGVGKPSIEFSEQPLTVLSIESLNLGGCQGGEEQLPALVDRLARQNGGTVDSFGWGGTAVFFSDLLDALRAALALMQGASDARLRIGVHSCDGVVASFRSGGEVHRTLLGSAASEAATVSGTAGYGSIGLSGPVEVALEERIGVPLGAADLPAWLFHEAQWAFQRTANGSLRLIPTSLARASS